MDHEKRLRAFNLGNEIMRYLLVDKSIAPDIAVEAIRGLADTFDKIEVLGQNPPDQPLTAEEKARFLPLTKSNGDGDGFPDGMIV